MKYIEAWPQMRVGGRAPHGARGLKWQRGAGPESGSGSRPARGAWIEIADGVKINGNVTSRPARGAWIEIDMLQILNPVIESRPARGAWIEIGSTGRHAEGRHGRAPHGARGLKS